LGASKKNFEVSPMSRRFPLALAIAFALLLPTAHAFADDAAVPDDIAGKKDDPPRPKPKPGPRDGGDDS